MESPRTHEEARVAGFAGLTRLSSYAALSLDLAVRPIGASNREASRMVGSGRAPDTCKFDLKRSD